MTGFEATAVGSGPGDAGYQALKHAAGAVAWARQAVRVAGPDAEKYLQGQTSQDVAKLVPGPGPGSWAWALVLQPQGKLDAFVRAYRAGEEEFFLDVDAGTAEALTARLLRFRLRTKADIEQVDWQFVAVRGPSAAAPPAAPAGLHVVGFEWGGLGGYDLAGPAAALAAARPGVPEVPAGAHHVVLVEAGFPRAGSELDERTIPAEAGLVDASVSFTKGCYTGQELVARIDSRGNNVARRLLGLRSAAVLQPGDSLFAARSPDRPSPDRPEAGSQEGLERRPVGRVTSVAVSPRLGPVALAYLSRAVNLGDEVRAERGDGGTGVPARVVALPF